MQRTLQGKAKRVECPERRAWESPKTIKVSRALLPLATCVLATISPLLFLCLKCYHQSCRHLRILQSPRSSRINCSLILLDLITHIRVQGHISPSSWGASMNCHNLTHFCVSCPSTAHGHSNCLVNFRRTLVFAENLLCTSTVLLNTLDVLTHLILTITQLDWSYYYPNFADQRTEAQREQGHTEEWALYLHLWADRCLLTWTEWVISS